MENHYAIVNHRVFAPTHYMLIGSIFPPYLHSEGSISHDSLHFPLHTRLMQTLHCHLLMDQHIQGHLYLIPPIQHFEFLCSIHQGVLYKQKLSND